MPDDKQFEKDLNEEMERAYKEMQDDFDKGMIEFQKTDEAKEIDACKTPEDFQRVMKKYHPEMFDGDCVKI